MTVMKTSVFPSPTSPLTGLTKSLMAYAASPCLPHKKVVRVLLDSASNKSLCKRNLASLLDLDGEPTDLTMHLAGGNTSTTTRENQVALRLWSLDESFSLDVKATTTKKVGLLPPMLFNPRDYSHLRGIELTEKFPVKREMSIDILLGEPYYSHLLLGGPILGEMGEPGAQRTKLGWALCATDPSGQAVPRIFRSQIEQKETMQELNAIMSSFSDLETMAVKAPPDEKEVHTAEELEALRAFQEGATFDPVDKCWVVRLPWKAGVAPSSNA